MIKNSIKIVKFIVVNHLQVIAVFLVNFLFFSQKSSTFYVHYFYFFGLGFATWLIYFTDQILDNIKRKTKGHDRHHLTASTIAFQLLVGAVLFILMVVNRTTLSINHLYFIATIAFFVAFYFTVILIKVGYLKEVFSALIMVVSIAVLPQFLQGDFEFKCEYFFFFFILFSNLILLSIADAKYDQNLGFNSLVKYLGNKLTINLLLFIIAFLILGSFWCLETIGLWLFVHALLTLLLLFFRKKIESHLMHFLADFILLFPLYYLSEYL